MIRSMLPWTTAVLGACCLSLAARAAEPDMAVFDAEGADPYGSWGREYATNAAGWSPQQIVASPARAGSNALRIEIQYLQPDVAGKGTSPSTGQS